MTCSIYRQRAVVTAFLGLILGACGGTPETSDDLGDLGAEIIKGVPTSRASGVVALIIGQGGLCTAEVIAPTVILTAAHCVHPSTAGVGTKFTVLTGSNLTKRATQGERLAVKEVHWNEKWNPHDLPGGHDIAVAILEKPTSIKPLRVNRRTLTAMLKGKSARIIGYGLNDGITKKGDGVKREARVKLNSLNHDFVQTGSASGARICNGDSGGPVLMTLGGVEQIVAVNSFGKAGCTDEANSTRTDADRDFLDRFVGAPDE
jgi:secreted trypsin-like serine protease